MQAQAPVAPGRPFPQANERALDASLRGYLETNADIVTRITKPVRIDDIGALSAQSEMPIVFREYCRKDPASDCATCS